MSGRYGFGLVVVVGLLILSPNPGSAPRDLLGSDEVLREVDRVRHHLETAEALLRERDVSRLTAAQRAARDRRIAELRAYRLRGVFPHNHRVFGRRIPVFVDKHGTRCAMAFLIEQSGERSLVSSISKTRNLARIRDLAGDPNLIAWLDRNGLTVNEAARIQPTYGDTPDEDETGTASWAALATGAGVSAVGVGLNYSIAEQQNARNLRGLAGVSFGLLGAGLGAMGLSEEGSARVVGVIDIGMGITSFVLGIRQLGATNERQPHAGLSTIAPTIWLDGGTRRFALVMRF